MFLKLLALAGAAFPLPKFIDKAAVQAWLAGFNDELAAVISALAEQLDTTGCAAIELPDGKVVTMVRDASGVFVMAEEDQTALCLALAGDPELPMKFGDGKILEAFAAAVKQLMPIILQILPYLLDNKDEPTPTPPPTVV